jgi:D-alanyl-D-alanine carboxypeptidase (penicillin-binding protein 5/6)
MKKIVLAITLLLLFFAQIPILSVSAQSGSGEIVMELNSNRVLYELNARDKKYMASTTKILTAITIIENCNLNDIVTVTKETVGVEGSSIYLEEGENTISL